MINLTRIGPLCMLLMTFSTAALADHDEDERHLNGYTLSFASPSSRQIVQMDSRTHIVPGNRSEIVERAQACVTRYVHDEPGVPTGVVASVFGAQGRHSVSTDSETPLIESADPDRGTLFAHSRAQFHHYLLSYEARSGFSIEATDGSFRIVQRELAYRQLDTGAAAQEFAPIQRLATTGWDDALEALQEVSDQVAECIGHSANDAG